jgi:hypothetical protein
MLACTRSGSSGHSWKYWGAVQGKNNHQWWCCDCVCSASCYYHCCKCLGYGCGKCVEAQQNKQQKQHRKQPDNADKWHRQSLAHQLTSPLVSSLDVGRHSITWGTTDWAAEACALFSKHGFVVLSGVLAADQHSAVLRDCERVAEQIVGPQRAGNRGPGRYSFGVASSSAGMLHVESFAQELLNSGWGSSWFTTQPTSRGPHSSFSQGGIVIIWSMCGMFLVLFRLLWTRFLDMFCFWRDLYLQINLICVEVAFDAYMDV